jgi:surface antigen
LLRRTKSLLTSMTVATVLALSFGGMANARAADYWQCVTFARMFSGIQLFGDAWTWWNQAIGKYTTGDAPQAGSVLVFKRNHGMRDGHVAVVSRVLTDRVIQVTHANWSVIEGGRGKVEQDVTVVDVSPKGDWSQVKVWYDPIRDLGNTVYPTYGFIYQTAQTTAKLASGNLAHAAVGQLASAAQSPTSAGQSLASAAAASTDRIADLLRSLADH